MDTPTPQPTVAPQVVQCQCRNCRRSGLGIIGGFFRFIGLLLLIAVVFIAGLAIGSFGPAGVFPFGHGMFWEDADDGTPRSNVMIGTNGGFRLKFGGDERNFGVVTAISGQKITIADNGGGTQTVSVTAETAVFDGEREIPVWNIRVGNSVRVMGPTKDAVINAKVIEVVR